MLPHDKFVEFQCFRPDRWSCHFLQPPVNECPYGLFFRSDRQALLSIMDGICELRRDFTPLFSFEYSPLQHQPPLGIRPVSGRDGRAPRPVWELVYGPFVIAAFFCHLNRSLWAPFVVSSSALSNHT